MAGGGGGGETHRETDRQTDRWGRIERTGMEGGGERVIVKASPLENH